MPETTGVVIYSLNSVRLQSVSEFVVLNGVLVPDYFHVCLANIAEHPSCVEMVLRQLFKLFDSLKTVVHQQVVVSFCQFLQQRHQVYVLIKIYLEKRALLHEQSFCDESYSMLWYGFVIELGCPTLLIFSLWWVSLMLWLSLLMLRNSSFSCM